MRWVITRVLPDPGPARISTGPSMVSTACLWAGFSPSRISLVTFTSDGSLKFHYTRHYVMGAERPTDWDPDTRTVDSISQGCQSLSVCSFPHPLIARLP